MPDDDQRPPTLTARLVRAIGILFGVILLYALSVGPVAWLLVGDSKFGDRAVWFYEPLGKAAEATGTDDLLFDYVLWWSSLAGGPLNPRTHQLPPQIEP